MHYFLCDSLLDLCQNSIEAGASLVEIQINQTTDIFSFNITDDAGGFLEDETGFFSEKHQGRKVGLGLAFAKQASSNYDIDSTIGKGTRVQFDFELSKIDTQPIGDLPLTLLAIFNLGNEGCTVNVERRKEGSSYFVSNLQLKKALGEIQSAESQVLALKYLRGLEVEQKELGKGENCVKDYT